MADYLALLRELAPIEPPLFVFGGIADAALLDDSSARLTVTSTS